MENRCTDLSQAGRAYLVMKEDGIAVLPPTADMVREGKCNLLDFAVELTQMQEVLRGDTPP